MNSPKDASDSQINSLWDLAVALQRESAKMHEADPTLAARLDADPELQSVKADELLRRTVSARAFDLSYDYASYRPEGERWICIDLNTYDGAPDAEAPCTFIGRGASEKEARTDLLNQFAELDNPEPPPRPRVSRVIRSSNAEPPTYSDERERDPDDVDFDSGLDDGEQR
jgi:hypothetical protein